MPFPFPAHGVETRRAYTPADYPGADTIEFWDPAAGKSLSSFLVDAWAGLKNGYTFTATGSKRFTYDPAGIVDQYGGTYPGMVLSGAQAMSCADAGLKASLGASQVCTIIMTLQKPNTGVFVLLELSADQSAVPGAFGIFGNNVNSYSIEPNIHSSSGDGIWRSKAGEAPFSDPGVMQFTFGNSTAGTSVQSLDGVQMRGAPVAAGNAYVATNFPNNQTLYLGGRAASSIFATGTLGPWGIFGPNATAAALRWVRKYIGARVGAVQA